MAASPEIVDSECLRELCSALLSARRAGHPIQPSPTLAPLRSIEHGKTAARMIEALLAGQGVARAGLKLGAVDPATQAAMELDGPLVAPFYDEWVLSSGSTLGLARLVTPRLEAEIGFRRVAGRWRPFACLEVVDTRVPGWSSRGGQVLADFGLNGAVVYGSPIAESPGMGFELCSEGVVVASGEVSLADAYERLRLADTRAGFVASGSLHPMIPLTEGEWLLRFSGGGEVRLTVDAADRC